MRVVFLTHNYPRWPGDLSGSFLGTLAAAIVLAGAAKAEPAMWVIRDKDSTIYLIGTVHALRGETVWDSAKVRKTMTESNELWLEVKDFDSMNKVRFYGASISADLKHIIIYFSEIENAQNSDLYASHQLPDEQLVQQTWFYFLFST